VAKRQEQGLVAVLDALGASNYSEAKITEFLKARQTVLGLLDEKIETVLGDIDRNRITTFTFNDTILIVYRTHARPTLKDVEAFCTLLRHFVTKSIEHGILLRGAISLGSFDVVDDKTSTVMGPVVTDAASWYDKADWIGIAATPQAMMLITALLESEDGDLAHLIVDYAVPMKGQPALPLKAINWPKGFYVRGLTPRGEGEHARAKCLSLLAKNGVPRGTESKHFNSMEFFDHCIKLWKEEKKRKNKQK